MGWLHDDIATVGTTMSSIWLAYQMVKAIQDQIDRRRARRLQAVQDVHTMVRADAMTALVVDAAKPKA